LAHAPDAPIAPEAEARAEELLRRPYTQVLRADPDTPGGYIAEAPELPGCVGAGDTPEEALAELRGNMGMWLLVAVEHGEPIPEPNPPPTEWEYSGKFLLRVPKSLHRRLAERAAREGVSLNQMAQALLAGGLGTG
jgi:antitoxin HicB